MANDDPKTDNSNL